MRPRFERPAFLKKSSMTVRALMLLFLVGACGTADRADQATTPAPDPAPSAVQAAAMLPPLTAQGWGPLRIGMSLSEITAALGPDADAAAVGGPDPSDCDQFRPKRAPPGLLVMVEQGRLTRISLVRDSELRTEKGIGLGDGRDAVATVYGPAAVTSAHKYVEAPAAYIDVWEGRGGGNGFAADVDSRGIRFEIDGKGVVGAIHAGGASILYVEGCS